VNNYRKAGIRETGAVAAGTAVTKGNLVEWSSGNFKNITAGAECAGVAMDTGAATETVTIERTACIIDVKVAAGVALAQGAKCYATGSTATYQGKLHPVVDAGSPGSVSVGVVWEADIITAGYGKMKVTPGDIYATTTISGS